jgi:hypothetical protein
MPIFESRYQGPYLLEELAQVSSVPRKFGKAGGEHPAFQRAMVRLAHDRIHVPAIGFNST